ncbi:hypothetical protein JOQ06_002945 [Pogonophryne albipinna]|uniref:C-type lectin domain-containing protein n=1 Tax=Pogonophryne albipinna TaxID=1090488 RepID=A0AAD6FM48_9TELE|nr:hypothetical protein JOQ06_002945 [Pogonophryne albipinna]
MADVPVPKGERGHPGYPGIQGEKGQKAISYDFVRRVGQKYFVSYKKRDSFSSAVEFCSQQGLELALPQNEEENSKLNQFFGDIHKEAWINVNNNKAEGNFLTDMKNRPLTFTKWGEGQPDKSIQGGAPIYFPNSFSAPDTQPQFVESKFQVSPDVARYNSADEDNYTQVLTFYTQVLNEEERQRLCQNMAGALKGAQLFIQKRQVENLKAVHADYGNRVQSLLNKYNAENKKNTEVHVYSRPGASAIAASSKM